MGSQSPAIRHDTNADLVEPGSGGASPVRVTVEDLELSNIEETVACHRRRSSVKEGESEW